LYALVILSSFLNPSHAGPSVDLTLENFEQNISGKNGLVKFQAPWWGHCKSLAPAWDKLAEEFAASSSVVIGDADCTAQGESLCHKFEIRGYPTIKYFKDGDVSSGEDYQGGRDFDSLKDFVMDQLEVKCNVYEPSECTEREKGYIEKMKAKTEEERTKETERLASMIGKSMKKELKQWISQRLHILKSLEQGSSDEL
jgi:protein disulfide-isomerase A6